MASPSSPKENKDDESAETDVLKKGQWTSEEDAILREYVINNGVGNWNAVRKHTGIARCGKSCRLRWSNHLRPDLKRGAFDLEEQQKIIQLHASMGNKWALIAQQLPGRTDNEIKNFWNTRIKKRKRSGLPLYPDDLKPTSSGIDNQENSLNDSTQEANNDSQTDTLRIVPELIFNNYKLHENHPLPIPPIPDITEYSTFDQQASGSDNPIIHPPEQLHDSDMVYNGLENSSNPIIHPPEQLHDSDMVYNGLENSSNPIIHPPEQLHDSDMVYNGLENSSINTAAPTLIDDVITCLAPQYASSTEPLTSPQLPPLPPFDDILREINRPIEHTGYYESDSPCSIGLLESMFNPQKIQQNSHHCSMHPCEIQREPNSGKKENLNIQKDFTNPNALPDFSSLENYGKDQSGLEDNLFAVIQPYLDRNTSSPT